MSSVQRFAAPLVRTATLLSLCTSTVAAAGPIVLTKDGTPAAAIVVGKSASRQERYAAHELQTYLNKISGARLPIRPDSDKTQGARILLGTLQSNNFIKGLQNQLTGVRGLGKEGFIIKTLDDDLVIVGGDSSGVLHGVYGFLEQYLGCRWYTLGEPGEVIPVRKTITLPPIDAIDKPSLPFRGLVICVSLERERETVDWLARQKMNHKITFYEHVPDLQRRDAIESRAIMLEAGGHNFWWLVPADQYYDKHPEYYPLIGGKRVRPDGRLSVHVQLCLSNPDVTQIVTDKLKAFISEYPDVEVLAVTPNDGAGWCECDNCRALGASQTDRLVEFVNAIAREIPNRYIKFLAYSDCTDPPSVKPLDNIIVEYVRNGRCYKHSLSDPHCDTNAIRRAEIEGWLEKVKSDHLLWGDYTDPWNDLPQPPAGVFAKDLKWFSELGMGGFTIAVTPASWDALRLNHYEMAKVSWNTDLTYAEVLDDFCRNSYGPAAAPMRRYYQALDRAVETSSGCFLRGNIANVDSILSEDLLRELKGYLAEAEQLAAGHEGVGRRLATEARAYGIAVRTVKGRSDVDAPLPHNVAVNPGFEDPDKGWQPSVQRGRYELAVEENGGRDAGKCAKIDCTEPGRAMWQQIVPVDRGEKYYFSAWVKAEAKPAGVTILWLHQGPTHRTGKLLYLDPEVDGAWRKYIVPEIVAIEEKIQIFLMSDGAGTIRFDDIVFRRIDPEQEPQ